MATAGAAGATDLATASRMRARPCFSSSALVAVMNCPPVASADTAQRLHCGLGGRGKAKHVNAQARRRLLQRLRRGADIGLAAVGAVGDQHDVELAGGRGLRGLCQRSCDRLRRLRLEAANRSLPWSCAVSSPGLAKTSLIAAGLAALRQRPRARRRFCLYSRRQPRAADAYRGHFALAADLGPHGARRIEHDHRRRRRSEPERAAQPGLRGGAPKRATARAEPKPHAALPSHGVRSRRPTRPYSPVSRRRSHKQRNFVTTKADLRSLSCRSLAEHAAKPLFARAFRDRKPVQSRLSALMTNPTLDHLLCAPLGVGQQPRRAGPKRRRDRADSHRRGARARTTRSSCLGASFCSEAKRATPSARCWPLSVQPRRRTSANSGWRPRPSASCGRRSSSR